MKPVVNRVYEDIRVRGTRMLEPILTGLTCDTPEGRERVRVSVSSRQDVREAITRRDGPFGNDGQAPREDQPRTRSELGHRVRRCRRARSGDPGACGRDPGPLY